MNIEKLTFDEKMNLWKQLNKGFDWFPVSGFGMQEVEDKLQDLIDCDEIDTMPSSEQIEVAISYVIRHAEVSVSDLIDWASDEAIKLSKQTQKV